MLSSIAAATEISNPNIKTTIREEKGKAILDEMKLKNILIRDALKKESILWDIVQKFSHPLSPETLWDISNWGTLA